MNRRDAAQLIAVLLYLIAAILTRFEPLAAIFIAFLSGVCLRWG